MIKVFISHASANKEYGNAIVKLLRGLGIDYYNIIFTSNTAYGIPIGQNIFNWLKSQISERPFVIYLISDEYYKSIATPKSFSDVLLVFSWMIGILTIPLSAPVNRASLLGG